MYTNTLDKNHRISNIENNTQIPRNKKYCMKKAVQNYRAIITTQNH